MFGCGEVSRDGNQTQGVVVAEKKLALEFSSIATQSTYMTSSFTPKSIRRGGNGVTPYGEGDESSGSNAPIDTLLKYAIAPVAETRETDAKIYDDGTMDLKVLRLDDISDQIPSNVPQDPNDKAAKSVDILDGQATMKDDGGNVIFQQQLEVPSLKEAIDSVKAAVERGEANGEATAALNEKALSLFGFTPQSGRSTQMLVQAKQNGAEIETSDGIAKITYRGTSAFGGMTSFIKPSTQAQGISPFGSDANGLVTNVYLQVSTGRQLAVEMLNNNELVSVTRFKYRDANSKGISTFSVNGVEDPNIPEMMQMEMPQKDFHGKKTSFINTIEYKKYEFKNHLLKGGN